MKPLLFFASCLALGSKRMGKNVRRRAKACRASIAVPLSLLHSIWCKQSLGLIKSLICTPTPCLLVRVAMHPEPIPGTLGAKWEYTLYVMMMTIHIRAVSVIVRSDDLTVDFFRIPIKMHFCLLAPTHSSSLLPVESMGWISLWTLHQPLGFFVCLFFIFLPLSATVVNIFRCYLLKGNRRTHGKPTRTWQKHAKFHTDINLSSESNPGVVRKRCYSLHHHDRPCVIP